MAVGDSMRLLWIDDAGCIPLHGRSQPRAHSSPCPPPPTAGCAPSPWPPQPGCASRHGQAATGHGGGEFVLEPRGFAGTRSMTCRRKLHPAAKSAASNTVRCRELQPCTLELQLATGGAARGEAIFANVFSFCRTNFVFAGTDVFFCWNRDIFFLLQRLQSSQMLMSFLLEPKFDCVGRIFDFASTDHRTLIRGEDFCWKNFAASDFCCLAL
ncbi:uncharacterized protein [Triticum aestivum]|uniref:uncharacterized protein isoform X1 n=1 Tax=Triticum aestivum TaxID=4565 RepID=UPI001D017200|nr:uncharacterized protein LOC123160825 isoform X1 [Triticum aestivum]